MYNMAGLGRRISLIPLQPLAKDGQHRGMATLKEISLRLKSVKNIQKITQSMKMVSAAKYTRAERELRQARPYGVGAQTFYDRAEISTPDAVDPDKPPSDLKAEGPQLVVAMSSDRGLCGAIHSSIAKNIRNELQEHPELEANTKIVCVGDKSRAILSRLFAKNILFVATEIGRKPPTYLDAAIIANAILESDYDFSSGKIIYNKYKSVVSYATSKLPMYSAAKVNTAPKLVVYDSLDDEVLQSYMEFSLAALCFFAMKEGACSELSSRMTAMDNASKNAGEMIGKLTMTFNRTRQAVITRELIEIISGAAALD